MLQVLLKWQVLLKLQVLLKWQVLLKAQVLLKYSSRPIRQMLRESDRRMEKVD